MTERKLHGRIEDVDFSAIERRLLGHYRPGVDVYADLMREHGLDPNNAEDRRRAKAIMFGIMYGSKP